MSDDEDENFSVPEFLGNNFGIVKANSGGIRFKIAGATIRRRPTYQFHLLKNCCSKPAYVILFGESSVLFDVLMRKRKRFNIPNFYNQNIHDFLLTWYNDEICIGIFDEAPLLVYPEINTSEEKQLIRYVKFDTSCRNGRAIDWIIKPTLEAFAQSVPKQVSGGELRWVQMTSGDILPSEALIGGFENEPLYVARARHRGSLCPGKYLRSKQIVYVPWGHEEHAKSEFEVLCGYDAIWLQCNGNNIPENAFVGGYSEVHREPLFIGRAWIHNNLVIGKVHMLYKTCYLPYSNKEVEKYKYEILVVGNNVRRGVP